MQKVLLVDDEIELLEIFSEILEEQGFEVSTAANGLDAYKSIESNRPDVVISDVQMPKMDGITLLEKAQTLPSPPPFIFLTGHSPISPEDAYKKGAKGVLSKPVKLDLLIKRIADVLRYEKGVGELEEITSDKKSAKIFVAEDQPEDQQLLKRALSDQKWSDKVSLQFFDSGNELVSHLESLRTSQSLDSLELPDLVFLDLNMPGKNGLDVLQELKVDPVLSSIPLIVLTSSSREGDMKEAYNLGADSFLVKPWTYESWQHLVLSIGQSWLPHLVKE